MPQRIQHFEGSIKQGKLTIKHKDLLNLWLESLGDGPVAISVGRTTRLRSLKANRYMWGWVYEWIVNEIHKQTGITREEVHAIAKARAKKFREYNGKVYEMTVSTSAMDEKEFSEFLEGVKQWVLEDFNIVVPKTLKERIDEDYNESQTD